jgi:type II secretory pathway component GspD/PulD (secretin)
VGRLPPTALLALLFGVLLGGGRAQADGPAPGSAAEGELSWRTRDGRLRALYRPKFVPAGSLLAEATAFGLSGVDLGLDELRGRLVLTGADGAVGSARDALDWLDAPTPEVLVKVAVVETIRRCRKQTGGYLLFDRDAIAGGPETFFRGVRAEFEPEDWLRAELVGGRYEGTTLAFGADEGERGIAGTIEQALRFLAHSEEAEFLAEPSLVCTEGVPASMEASIAVPIPTIQRTGLNEVRGFLSEKAGVRLEVVVDRVGADSVTLRLHPWLRQVTAESWEHGPDGAPVFAVREMETRLTISDGDTVLVGGLEHLRRSRARDALPGVAATGLDGLLSSSAREGESSEVLFLVGVRILTPGREHGGSIPPGEAERLLRRGTRARILPYGVR